MIKIGPITYTKKEEGTVLASSFLGFACGIPLGAFLSYSAGLLKKLPFTEADAGGLELAILRVGLMVGAACWMTGIVSCILVSRRNGFASSGEIRKMVVGTVLIPLIFMLALLVFAFVTVPIDAFLYSRFGIRESYAVDILVFAPFVVLFVATFVPDSRPGKAIRHFINRGGKSRKKRHLAAVDK